MAQTMQDIRALARTTIRGRRFGIDGDEYITGVRGIRKVVTNATSATTATALPNHGLVSVVTTTDDSWTLTDPEVGCEVMLVTGSTSTGVHTITGVAATIISSVSDNFGIISFIGGGASACGLMGLTTAVWGVISRSSTTTVLFTSA